MNYKCPYCKGKNIYLKRTWPEEVYGCRDCDKKVKLLRDKGLTESEIRQIITREETT